MLQKSGRLVLWEAMFILELHSAETQVLFLLEYSHPCELEFLDEYNMQKINLTPS